MKRRRRRRRRRSDEVVTVEGQVEEIRTCEAMHGADVKSVIDVEAEEETRAGEAEAGSNHTHN